MKVELRLGFKESWAEAREDFVEILGVVWGRDKALFFERIGFLCICIELKSKLV